MIANNKNNNWIVRYKILLAIVLAVLFGGTLLYLLIPNTYTVSGIITNNFNEPIKDITLSFGGKEIATNEKGEYQISGIANNQSVKIIVPASYAYISPTVDIDYKKAQQKGLKFYQINQDIKIKYNVKDFVDQILTNQKFTRHNIIWSYLDKSSQEVFGAQEAYEKFFKAILGETSSDSNINSYTILDDKTTVREKWTSAQGIEYGNVFEVPYEEIAINGGQSNKIFYAVPLNNKLVITSSYTREMYATNKQLLIDIGYLTN